VQLPYLQRSNPRVRDSASSVSRRASPPPRFSFRSFCRPSPLPDPPDPYIILCCVPATSPRLRQPCSCPRVGHNDFVVAVVADRRSSPHPFRRRPQHLSCRPWRRACPLGAWAPSRFVHGDMGTWGVLWLQLVTVDSYISRLCMQTCILQRTFQVMAEFGGGRNQRFRCGKTNKSAVEWSVMTETGQQPTLFLISWSAGTLLLWSLRRPPACFPTCDAMCLVATNRIRSSFR
jgi:hypothetical protein